MKVLKCGAGEGWRLSVQNEEVLYRIRNKKFYIQ
jgi:hypothetical protein